LNELRGTRLGGCELLEEIGQGGMGLIYRARQLSLDRVVAVKILADHLAHNPSFVERFQREARAIARINHSNILGVYDVGCQDKRHYMIMELVDGGSVAELLEKRGVLEPGESAELVIQAARGLECAANQNIIHRDVKPDNIMLTAQHLVKVSDFGLAKELDSTMTETQAVMGTPAYMSPEQCDGRDLDSRTDIYSLGGTFYRCITGRLPFEADTAMSMMYRHKHVPLTPPRDIIPTLPQAVSDIICKMMAKDREERFQSMGEVAKALEDARSSPPGQGFDPARTMPLEGAEPEVGDEHVPAFLRSDTRIIRKPAPQSAADTQIRSRQTVERLRSEGKLAQAARELRRLLELVPDDQDARKTLRDLEERVSIKRRVNGEIRSLVSSSHYEEALEKWNALDADLRDNQLAGQMERLSTTVVPSLKLVTKAEATASGGRLEEAGELYEQAIKLDPNSEKAKQGLKSIEKAKQRIQFLLKEGYSHRQNRDYSQAVEVWQKILAVEPDNSQARRLIVEARMEAAGEAGNAEKFDQVVKHCEAVLEIDPKHSDAGRMLADAAAKRDRVAELRRAAELARSKGDLGASIRAYRELTHITPKSRVAKEGLQSTRKALSKSRTRRLLVLLLLSMLATGGYYTARQWLLMDKARRYFKMQLYDDARREARHVWHPLWKSEAQEVRRRAVLQAYLKAADNAEEEGNWEQALEAMHRILKDYRGPDRATYERRQAGYEYKLQTKLAREAERKAGTDPQAWKDAQALHIRAKNAAARAGDPEGQQNSGTNGSFCHYVAEGIKKAMGGNNSGARIEFQSALDLRFGADRSELPSELVEMMKRVGADPR
jgi:serine/threonine protein kinase